jgi:hypothetical protein
MATFISMFHSFVNGILKVEGEPNIETPQIMLRYHHVILFFDFVRISFFCPAKYIDVQLAIYFNGSFLRERNVTAVVLTVVVIYRLKY